MAGRPRGAHQNLEDLMGEVGEYGTRSVGAFGDASDGGAVSGRGRPGGSRWSSFGAGLAALTSIIALVFSGYSFYETVLKRAELRIYTPPLIYLYRQDFRDVFAIPVTISNDGAQRGTILSFDLEVTHLETQKTMLFQNLHFGASPKGDVRLFTPVTVQGRSTFTDVILFHALKTGAFFETTGGVKLPLRLKLSMNLDRHDDWTEAWYRTEAPKPIVFDMTANYIQGFRDMESGRPTRLHDARWTGGEAAADTSAPPKPAERPADGAAGAAK